MGRHANPDIRRAFAEFNDTDSPSKVGALLYSPVILNSSLPYASSPERTYVLVEVCRNARAKDCSWHRLRRGF